VQGDVVDVMPDGHYTCGQWVSRYFGLSRIQFDTNQKEQEKGTVGGGEGVQQGTVPAKDFHREHQCQDKGVQNHGTSLPQQKTKAPVTNKTYLRYYQRRKSIRKVMEQL